MLMEFVFWGIISSREKSRPSVGPCLRQDRGKESARGREQTMQLIQYEKCSTCKKAAGWLRDHNISFESRPIREERPTEEELGEWQRRSGLPLKRFFNTSGLQYKALGLKDKLPGMTEEEQLALLATDGMLVKRPILVGEDFVLAGFKEKEWAELLLNENGQNG